MSISPKVMRSRRGESLWWGTGQTRSQLRFFWFSSQFVWFKLLTLGERMGKGCLIWAGMENQAVGPPDPSTLLAIQDGNNITTVDSPRNFQKNGYEWIVGLRFFTLLVILHLLNYFFCPWCSHCHDALSCIWSTSLAPKTSKWRFPDVWCTSKSSIYRLIFHEINHPAMGVHPLLENPRLSHILRDDCGILYGILWIMGLWCIVFIPSGNLT